MSSPRLLEWDTEFWGFRVGQGDSAYDDEWAQANVDVMCLLVPAEATEELRRIEAANLGYSLVDIRVEYARRTGWISTCRQHVDDDVDRLAEIARTAHRQSRFYADPAFFDDRCDDLYETWIRNSCAGWASAVLVTAQKIGDPYGYCTAHLDGETARIGLIAVAEEQRGRGYGKALLDAAVDYAFVHRASEITVATQGRNIDAQRHFQAGGFRLTSTALWFHKDFR